MSAVAAQKTGEPEKAMKELHAREMKELRHQFKTGKHVNAEEHAALRKACQQLSESMGQLPVEMGLPTEALAHKEAPGANPA